MQAIKHKLIMACVLLVPAGAAFAEGHRWTLGECIDYAMKHNADVQTGELSVTAAGEDVKESKARLFPSLSFSTTHQGGYAPFADSSDGDKGRYSGDYGLNASWTVWNGNADRNRLKQQKLVLAAGGAQPLADGQQPAGADTPAVRPAAVRRGGGEGKRSDTRYQPAKRRPWCRDV